VSGDARAWRIALLPDALVNATDAGRPFPDVLALLEAHGYGLLQLPPAGNHALLLAVIADQVAEYAHHGYVVVAIGLQGEPGEGLHWRRLSPLLRHRGVSLPPRYVLGRGAAEREAERLGAFLDSQDLPAEEQRIWRS
jgi:hypothetical protein